MAKLHTNPTVAACKLTIPAPYDVWLCGWHFYKILSPLSILITIAIGYLGFNFIKRINHRLSAY
jgi:hypothetical protein